MLVSCQQQQEEVQTYTSGKEKILIDESLAPIIEDQTYVFESTYPNAKLELITRSENELINSFLDASAQVAILSRELSDDERKHFENKKIYQGRRGVR